MATWMIAARAVVGFSSRTSRQTVSLSANQASKLIQRRGLASGADHHVPPKVDLKQEAKDKKGADYILYTGLLEADFAMSKYRATIKKEAKGNKDLIKIQRKQVK